MRLTNYTDYSLRVLIYLSLKKPNELANITEIAEAYDISRNHLTKVIHELGRMGVIHTIRGRGGGIKLAMRPEEINIGEIVRKTEDDFNIVECFEDGSFQCVISPVCGLKHVLNDALSAYFNVLDQFTIADIVKGPNIYRTLLGLEQHEKSQSN